MKTYSLGYLRDLPETRHLQPKYLFHVGDSGVPDAVSHESHEHAILDQNTTGSCTGHGTAQGVFVAFSIDGSPLSYCPSPKCIYTDTLALERALSVMAGQALPPLQDVGARPALVMTAISQYGVRSMQAPSPLGYNSDVDSSNVTDEPRMYDLEEESDHVSMVQNRIDETQSNFIEQVCLALARGGAKGLGAPVGVGCFVDMAFMNYDPQFGPMKTVDLTDPKGGGHWFLITSYRTGADGKKIFRGPNSWGPGWGDAGHFEVTEDWLKKSCWDCYPFIAIMRSL